MIHRDTQIDRFHCCCSFADHPAISGCALLGVSLLVIVAFRCPLFTSALCERKPESYRSTTQNISNFHFVFFDASVQQFLPFSCVRVCVRRCQRTTLSPWFGSFRRRKERPSTRHIRFRLCGVESPTSPRKGIQPPAGTSWRKKNKRHRRRRPTLTKTPSKAFRPSRP